MNSYKAARAHGLHLAAKDKTKLLFEPVTVDRLTGQLHMRLQVD